MKKLIKLILPIILASFIITPVFATSPSFEGRKGDACPFLIVGLKSWDCDVNITQATDKKGEGYIGNGLWKIALNIAEDISVIASYLIIGYVIYAGYLYMFSGGDPGKVATGKKALAHAFIGLAIVMLAKVIMGTISAVFGSEDPTGMVSATIGWFIAVSGIVAAIFVVYGGVTYMTSAGDPSKVQKAKQTLIYALIGLAIVALSAAISSFVFNTINNSKNTSRNVYQKSSNLIISKEVHEHPIN